VDSRDQAKNLLDHIMKDLLPREAGYHSWEAQCAVVAHVCRELEAERHAPELFELLSPLRGRIIPRGHVGCHGPASLYLGLLADLMGRPAEAIMLFEEAVALAESVSASPWIARIRYCEARALATSRDAAKIDQARSHAEQSKTLAQKLGMKRIEVHATRLLASLVDG
jgi:hypothetical protein